MYLLLLLQKNPLSAKDSQQLSESRGGRPGLPVPNKPYGICGRKAWRRKKIDSCPKNKTPTKQQQQNNNNNNNNKQPNKNTYSWTNNRNNPS